MRILAFSDIQRWEGYEALVDEYRPDIVVLAGDLTSDGNAAFWDEALEHIPEFAKRKSELLRGYGLVEREKDFYTPVAPPVRFCDRFFFTT
jgi:metallophosphoesterase superfamily enzyme